MHAANYTNINPPLLGWHGTFENDVMSRQSGIRLPTEYISVQYATVPDDYFIAMARNAKKLYVDYSLGGKIGEFPVGDELRKRAVEVTQPMLTQVITTASQYMVAWMELAEPKLQPVWHWFNNGAPTGQTVAGGVAVTTMSERPCAFVRGGTDGHLWVNWWDENCAAWRWDDHGTCLEGKKVAGPVGAVTDGPHTHVFMQSSDRHLWRRYYDRASDSWQWFDQDTPSGTVIVGGPVGVALMSGAPCAFVRGSDDQLWVNWLTNPKAPIKDQIWRWDKHDNAGGPTAIADGVGVLSHEYANIFQYTNVFFRGCDGKLWRRYWNHKTRDIWRWANHGTPPNVTRVAGPVGVTRMGNNDCAFVRGSENNLWLSFQDNDGYWRWYHHPSLSDFATIAGPVGVVTIDSVTHTFVLGQDGSIWVNYGSPGHWRWINHGTPDPVGGIADSVGATTINIEAVVTPCVFVRSNDGNLWFGAAFK